jgi:hypothetical protein
MKIILTFYRLYNYSKLSFKTMGQLKGSANFKIRVVWELYN